MILRVSVLQETFVGTAVFGGALLLVALVVTSDDGRPAPADVRSVEV